VLITTTPLRELLVIASFNRAPIHARGATMSLLDEGIDLDQMMVGLEPNLEFLGASASTPPNFSSFFVLPLSKCCRYHCL